MFFKNLCNRSKPKIKACILDWSGTTADAFAIAPAKAFCDAFKKYGVPITMDEARIPMGLRKDKHISEIMALPDVMARWNKIKKCASTKQDAKILYDSYLPIQLSCIEQCSALLPGVVETVDTLRNNNILIGSTTGFTREMENILLKTSKIQGYVPDASVAGDDIPNGLGTRPMPFMIYENMRQLGVYPVDMIVKVDDTNPGIEEGKNARTWTVGVYGWSSYMNVDSLEEWSLLSDRQREQKYADSKRELSKSNPDFLIRDITELPKVVSEINLRLAKGIMP